MSITGSKIRSAVTFKTLKKTGIVTPTASASVTSLTINAPLLGIDNVTLAGVPTADQVLFHNSDFSIAVYANRQTYGMTSDKVSSVKDDAIDVNFSNFSVAGHTINGYIEIATDSAN
jgi:hypothetical protein